MLFSCEFVWFPGTRREDVARRVVVQHDAGANHLERIQGWYNLAGGGTGFPIVDDDTIGELTAFLQPYMELMSFDVGRSRNSPTITRSTSCDRSATSQAPRVSPATTSRKPHPPSEAAVRKQGETSMAELQRTQGEGREPEHTHSAATHTHDQWHVSHHVNDAGEVEHRGYWHTHEHIYNEPTHSHDHSREDGERHHAREAHIHDHAAPCESPA